MTGFCEHGSSGHFETGNGDVMDDEVGDSGRARAPRMLNLTAGPSTSGSTDTERLEAFAALSSYKALLLDASCKNVLVWTTTQLT